MSLEQNTRPDVAIEQTWDWKGTSSDPNDEQFGDIIEQTTLEDASEYDAVLVGEPYDGAVIGRAGAREGPEAIRKALASTKTHHFDAGPVNAVGDLGTVEIPAGESVSAVQAAVREVAEAVYDAETIPVFLGGDNSLTYANVVPLLEGEKAGGRYVTDGGFGRDNEPVGDVEHFDPTGGSTDDDDEDETDATEDETDEAGDADESAEDDCDAAQDDPNVIPVFEDEEEATADEESEDEAQADDDNVQTESEDETPADEPAEEVSEVSMDETHETEDEVDVAEETDVTEDSSEPETTESDPAENVDPTDQTETTAQTEKPEQAEVEPAADHTETTETAEEPTETAEQPDDETDEPATSTTEDQQIGTVETNGADETNDNSVGVISLDAHLDVREVDGQPSSGTPYRQLLDAGLDCLAVVGARHFETSTAYADELREQGGEIITAEEVGDDPVEAANRALATMEGVDSVYLSVDMDVLDTTAAPGVSAPTPGGITTRELFRLVRLLASEDRLAGIEVVETAPPLCSDGRTERAAARTVAHALSVAGGSA